MEIRQVETDEDIGFARQLFEEYAASLDFSLSFQNFAEELARFPGEYGPPSGGLLLACSVGQAAGCVAFRQLEEEVCEMKRLYVRPSFRGLGMGRKLVEEVITRAKKAGYSAMRLDSVPEQVRAQELYTAVGFEEIDSYRYNPIEGARYMELRLE